MKEAEQDLLEESSNYTQRSIWNKESKMIIYKDFLLEEIQNDKQRRQEQLRLESSDDNKSSIDIKEKSLKKIYNVKKKIRSHHIENKTSCRKRKIEKRSLKDLLESFLALTEKENSISSTENSYQNYRVPNCF